MEHGIVVNPIKGGVTELVFKPQASCVNVEG